MRLYSWSRPQLHKARTGRVDFFLHRCNCKRKSNFDDDCAREGACAARTEEIAVRLESFSCALSIYKVRCSAAGISGEAYSTTLARVGLARGNPSVHSPPQQPRQSRAGGGRILAKIKADWLTCAHDCLCRHWVLARRSGD